MLKGRDQLAEEPGKLCDWERVVGICMACSESNAVVRLRCVRRAN